MVTHIISTISNESKGFTPINIFIGNFSKKINLVRKFCANYLTKGQRKIVSEVHDQLVSSPDTDVTVEALAKKYGISPISLNKYFSIMYGDTVHKYLQSYRMDYAAKLLADTDKSIADIALDVGYENQGKFATLFKRIYGMSPLEYRR